MQCPIFKGSGFCLSVKCFNIHISIDFTEILDDLADGIDRTTVGLIKETNQVRTIARRDATCGYWVVIILLFIAILVVAFV